MRRLCSRRAKRRVIVRSVSSALSVLVLVLAGNIDDFVEGVGVVGGKTVSVILLLFKVKWGMLLK